jgi:hypothetical protein
MIRCGQFRVFLPQGWLTLLAPRSIARYGPPRRARGSPWPSHATLRNRPAHEDVTVGSIIADEAHGPAEACSTFVVRGER